MPEQQQSIHFDNNQIRALLAAANQSVTPSTNTSLMALLTNLTEPLAKMYSTTELLTPDPNTELSCTLQMNTNLLYDAATELNFLAHDPPLAMTYDGLAEDIRAQITPKDTTPSVEITLSDDDETDSRQSVSLLREDTTTVFEYSFEGDPLDGSIISALIEQALRVAKDCNPNKVSINIPTEHKILYSELRHQVETDDHSIDTINDEHYGAISMLNAVSRSTEDINIDREPNPAV